MRMSRRSVRRRRLHRRSVCGSERIGCAPSTYAGPHLQSDLGGGVADCLGAQDRARRSVERRQQSVSRRLDLTAPEAFQLSCHCLVVTVDERAPSIFAHLGEVCVRAGDLGEQNRCQNAFGVSAASDSGKEVLDLVRHSVGVRRHGRVHVDRRSHRVRGGSSATYPRTQRERGDAVRIEYWRHCCVAGHSRTLCRQSLPLRRSRQLQSQRFAHAGIRRVWAGGRLVKPLVMSLIRILVLPGAPERLAA